MAMGFGSNKNIKPLRNTMGSPPMVNRNSPINDELKGKYHNARDQVAYM
jgi:hypothetical protein